MPLVRTPRLLLLGAWLLTACAGTAPKSSGPAATPAAPARAEPPPDLETIRPGLRHLEDSLVLDLLLGHAPRAGRVDAETERRARAAGDQLEYMLRHGGIKDRGGEAHVIPAPEAPGKKLTLRETGEQLSDALLRNVPGTPWRPETEIAREIQRQRPALSSLVEDADWVLTLSAALEGGLPASEKARLRRLHEHYAARVPHTELAAEVSGLLPDLPDERLRREVKKLANRSWERERRLGAGPAAAVPESAPAKAATPPAPAPSLPSLPPATLPAEPPAPAAADTAATALPETDTLVTPDRYCTERRAEAAQAFAAARSAGTAARRTALLRQSLDLLDACLTRYPGIPEADKARQNRARVEQELKP